MRVLRTALFGALTVSAVSFVLFRAPDPAPCTEDTVVPRLSIDLSRKPAPVFQALEKQLPPQAEERPVPPVEIRVSPEAEAMVEPVQTLEERGDAMLFEADALASMPFDEAITMPFD